MNTKAFNKTYDLNTVDCVTLKNLAVELSEQLTKEQKRGDDLIDAIELLSIQLKKETTLNKIFEDDKNTINIL